VDTAREYTYREDFPRPRAGFAKHLWTRAEVLDWFAELAPSRVAEPPSVPLPSPRPRPARPAPDPRPPQPAPSHGVGRTAGAPKPYTPRRK
jgi:hypothetical protein